MCRLRRNGRYTTFSLRLKESRNKFRLLRQKVGRRFFRSEKGGTLESKSAASRILLLPADGALILTKNVGQRTAVPPIIITLVQVDINNMPEPFVPAKILA